MKPGLIVLRVTGNDAWNIFKHEAGGHRFQRVPPTERKGRVHSSTVTVAVLPEPSKAEVVLHDKDLKIETKRGSGPGGQHKNKTESAVRIVHLPTGIEATCDSRDQHHNKELALATLRARIQQARETGAAADRNNQRRQQVGLGQRGDKIRTVSEQNGVVSNHLNGKKMDFKRYMRGFIEEIH